MNKIIPLFLCMLWGCDTTQYTQTESGQKAGPLVHDSNKQIIPLGGNAWVSDGGLITDEGLTGWSDTRSVCRVYVRFSQVGNVKVSLFLHAQNGNNTIGVSILNKSKEVAVGGNTEQEYYAGEWYIDKAGYVPIEIRGLSKSGDYFGLLSRIGVSGTAVDTDMTYVKNNDDNYFYWGRRGPSVHLNYNTKSLGSIEWFYSEITVPQGNDVIGSYFMANGFAEGYFGMQVNSSVERRILFSVWSPYQTDDPNAIPEDHKIIMLKKGENVYTGEFGNEGSGGQSFLTYNWVAGNTYGFLLRAQPADRDYTIYTAWFFAPEENKWRLIAQFKRPHTSTYLKDLYSFLENFEPETGNTSRMAWYGNQWVMDTKGKWSELNEIVFTGDNTARKNFRKDYAGGMKNGRFYLTNCGFFSDYTALDQSFVRPLTKTPPTIEFLKLP